MSPDASPDVDPDTGLRDDQEVLAFGDELADAMERADGADIFVVGRAGDVVVDDARVSRRHLEVSVDGDTTWCADLGSANGSWLVRAGDRTPLGSGVALEAGDVVVTIDDVEVYRHDPPRSP